MKKLQAIHIAAKTPILVDPMTLLETSPSEKVDYQFWLNHKGALLRVTALSETELVVGQTDDPQAIQHIHVALAQRSSSFTEYLPYKTVVPLDKISEVVLLDSVFLNVYYGEPRTRSRSVEIHSSLNAQLAESVLTALHKRLGPQFKRTSVPVNLKHVIVFTGVLWLITAIVTASVHWGVLQGTADLPNDHPFRWLLTILLPNLIVFAGWMFAVLMLGFLIYNFIERPSDTHLKRDPDV